jgi:hypothetical protein
MGRPVLKIRGTAGSQGRTVRTRDCAKTPPPPLTLTLNANRITATRHIRVRQKVVIFRTAAIPSWRTI